MCPGKDSIEHELAELEAGSPEDEVFSKTFLLLDSLFFFLACSKASAASSSAALTSSNLFLQASVAFSKAAKCFSKHSLDPGSSRTSSRGFSKYSHCFCFLVSFLPGVVEPLPHGRPCWLYHKGSSQPSAMAFWLLGQSFSKLAQSFPKLCDLLSFSKLRVLPSTGYRGF